MMKNLLAIYIEAELRALFLNCQNGATLIIALGEIFHQQPHIPVVTYSATGDRFINNNIRQQR